MDQHHENNRYLPIYGKNLGRDLPDDIRIVDCDGSLEIEIVSPINIQQVIRFSSYLSYRKINGTESHETFYKIANSSKLGSLIYIVKNSEYVGWFKIENGGIRREECLLHFCITTYTSIIDIITLEGPLIDNKELEYRNLF